ncbi:hypothetical protein [Streptomyces sp. NBC_00564]|uniref:hypothetical protein n=1 Tax=Streptomyces sp. NBC_00564 TaxID=2903663 RepID=UPI002FCDA9A8|nr:hypothetical protein OG256_46010 [Streptomyces sp. NBC_00564]
MVASKEIRQLIDEARRQGFGVELRGNGHYKVSKDGVYVTTLPSTPSSSRAIPNARAALRRHGFQG